MDKLHISYSQLGRSIWISHLDMMRMLQRAMNRANVPIRYSEGFNPHALISIVLPLSVGTESLCQAAEIRVKEELDLAELPGRLTAVMPEGIVVSSASEDGDKAGALSYLRALCRWDYDEPVGEERLDALRALLAQPDLTVQRRTKRGEGPFALYPHLRELELSAEGSTVWVKALLPAAEPVVKPELLSKAVLENAPQLAPAAVLCRRLELLKADLTPFR